MKKSLAGPWERVLYGTTGPARDVKVRGDAGRWGESPSLPRRGVNRATAHDLDELPLVVGDRWHTQ